MAEYNPSKIIKDGNTYNFRDTTKIPLAGSNEISGSLIPSTDGTVNLGSPSYQWNNAYIKSLTINGVACGDILTHNVSEFVDVSSNQTVGGIKTFSNAPVVSSINLDGKTIDTDANGNMTFNSHIVDTIEEQGDGYIRYSNGIQICWGSISQQSDCITPWGSLFESEVMNGSYAKSFVENPAVSISGNIGGSAAIIESSAGGITVTPNIYLCRAVARNEVVTCTARYIAIGRWK